MQKASGSAQGWTDKEAWYWGVHFPIFQKETHWQEEQPGFPQKGLQEGQNAFLFRKGYAFAHGEHGMAASR